MIAKCLGMVVSWNSLLCDTSSIGLSKSEIQWQLLHFPGLDNMDGQGASQQGLEPVWL